MKRSESRSATGSKPQITIRPATTADASAVLHCLHTAFAPYRDQYSPNAFADTVLSPETLLERMKTMDILVAVSDEGNIVGTVACHVLEPDAARKKDGHIRGMAVLPSHQGNAVGEQLLRAAESQLRAAGCSRMLLDTTAPLERAIRFYEKNGFRRSGMVRDFFAMPLFEYVKDLKGGST
jgi:ribosomal protein S18 acetylase RimI-like enzyme